MTISLPSYQSKITRGLAIVALINLVSMIGILTVLRPVLVGSLTEEYLESLGGFINEDIRYILLVGDPVTTKEYVENLIDFPWVYSARLFDKSSLIVEAGREELWRAPESSYTSRGGVHVIGDRVHLTRKINLYAGEEAGAESVNLHITILDESLTHVIDRILYLLVFAVAVVSLGLFGVSLYFARRVSRVVTQLSDGMQMVEPERGEVLPIALSTGIREFETVQSSFNELVKRVDARNDEQEKQIQSRTQALAMALDQKEHAYAVRLSLIMNLSHDLLTPLTANIGYLDIALEELGRSKVDPDRLRYAIESARSRGQMLSEEVSTLLQYSVSAEDLSQIIHQNIDIRKLTEDALKATELARKASGNVVEFTYTGPDTINTAGRLVRHVLENLLSNANRYCTNGVVEVICHVDTCLHLTVADNGCGIPDDEREHIFEPHFRSAVNKVVGPKGMGVGLAMVKTWVDHLNGTISLSPESGRTVFCVKIPETKG